jgi:hypothetical protein
VTGAAMSGRARPSGRTGAARRVTLAGFGDVRLWLGIALVVAAMGAGSFIVTTGHDTVTVMQATRDLAVGAVPTDLVPVTIGRTSATQTYLASSAPVDAVLVRSVHAGELVPASALGSRTARPHRTVTLPVDPLHAPTALQGGDHVDVWLSSDRAGDGGASRLVLADAQVVAVSADRTGVGGEIAVAIEVPESDVGAVVTASRTGVIDLVAVPVDDSPAQDPASVVAAEQ